MIFLKRTILHCDLNNFYASVACRDNPQLRLKPVAVCGDPERRHGIVLAKNYIAKDYGVQTGETILSAVKKCPGLITVLPDFKKYAEISAQVLKIYAKYSDLIEPFGPDEAWIDASGSTLLFGNGEDIARLIKEEVKSTVGLTISVGVSFNKIFAKIGSDLKKPDAITVITPENFKDILWGLDVGDMFGVGISSKTTLNSVGIYTIGELANADENLLKRILGKGGKQLKLFALGLDTSAVAHIDYKAPPKSIGHSTTDSRDLYTLKDVWKVLLSLSESVAKDLRREKAQATAVQLQIRNSVLQVTQIQKPLQVPCNTGIDLAHEGMDLFCKKYDFSMPLRSIGIRAINLVAANEDSRQLYLFRDVKTDDRTEKLERQMDFLHEKYGKNSIKRCTLL